MLVCCCCPPSCVSVCVCVRQVVVFCNANERVARVAAHLRHSGVCSSGSGNANANAKHEVMTLCGSMAVEDRLAAMASLKSGACKVLVASDVSARGVDAQGVSGVVNFDVPSDAATYVHRVGRAGRFGRRGVCVTLVQSYRDQLGVMGDVDSMLDAPVRPWMF